jgi:hypothetical protein
VFLAESLLFFPSIFSLPFTLSAQVQTGVFTVVFALPVTAAVRCTPSQNRPRGSGRKNVLEGGKYNAENKTSGRLNSALLGA